MQTKCNCCYCAHIRAADRPRAPRPAPTVEETIDDIRVKFGSTGSVEMGGNEIIARAGIAPERVTNQRDMEAPGGFEPPSKGFADPNAHTPISHKTLSTTSTIIDSGSKSGQPSREAQ